eukprot:TRINITY_DN245_c0_g1_i3.p1 TRINITY_DN245_c0_g1~~TRINITY_DN245_c0_g1_i3.p1  ORF type:complete len:219 (+),score=29.61 TRINITY_DN245_c0_g1_i3:266-922(+)
MWRENFKNDSQKLSLFAFENLLFFGAYYFPIALPATIASLLVPSPRYVLAKLFMGLSPLASWALGYNYRAHNDETYVPPESEMLINVGCVTAAGLLLFCLKLRNSAFILPPLVTGILGMEYDTVSEFLKSRFPLEFAFIRLKKLFETDTEFFGPEIVKSSRDFYYKNIFEKPLVDPIILQLQRRLRSITPTKLETPQKPKHEPTLTNDWTREKFKIIK